MKSIAASLLLTLSLQIFAQEANELTGLWLIKEVQVGDEIMTPDAKWTRLNEDFSQTSGNGWFQHSIGTWEFNQEAAELQIITDNGLDDPFGPFVVVINGDQMSWKREEDGAMVLVRLERVIDLPPTFRDKLLGLWKLAEVTGNGEYYREDFDDTDYLFIKWNGRFEASSGGKKTYGVYNVHSHKPEIELIPYGDKSRSFWKMDLLESGFEMSLLNSKKEVKRRFERTRRLPNQ